MPYRIEVLAHNDDGRAKTIEKTLAADGVQARVRVVDVYTSENKAVQDEVFTRAVCNPVTQVLNPSYEHGSFDYAFEIGFLPGVTDNVGHTAQEILSLAAHDDADNACYASRLYLVKGVSDRSVIDRLLGHLSNTLIQRVQVKDAETFHKDGGMDVVIPRVHLKNTGHAADTVALDGPDSELETLGRDGIPNPDGTRRGPLGLSLLYMQAIKEYFDQQENRPPTDIEIETIAQTWSEHCKHTIFASPIDDIKDGIYRHYIKRATNEIREAQGEDDICVSVFSDNAGGIIFNEDYLITDKVETHNSPSALDPFGGSITGIVGVNRDCMGFGKGAKPVINRYGFCLADPHTSPALYRDRDRQIPILPPATIMNGVVHGVEAGGNQSGIPTPQGFVYFDERYVGKPLVFVGTIGLIPRMINGTPGHEKKARPGDKILMVGGRVGRDGIHGATFSSVALDEESPATAVQIGDPITQKKMSDAIIKEIRDLGLYSAITDNGAGGLSSSVGEMAEQSGGFHVELETVPLKYPGMAPWEIWISESQERMTLAVPPENTDDIIARFAKRGVEATVIGTYTDTGRAHITWHGETVMDMSMDFLHDGIPETPLSTTFTPGGEQEPDIDPDQDYGALLQSMLARLNICSKEFIAAQYDHNVQGTAVLGPLQGKGRVYAEATVTRPLLSAPKGAVLSQGLFPRYGDIDTYHMATAALDAAVRNAVAAGADIHHLALLDNFCWCSSDEPERLGQLKRAAQAIYDLSTLYQTPLISGKDSMFNDFKGFDEAGQPVKISAPPTVLMSSIGVVADVEQVVSLAPKAVGDILYVLGETRDELGGSEYYDHRGHLGQNVPETHGPRNMVLYKTYTRAVKKRLIASALPVGLGGLGIALAKKSIAGRAGMEVDLSALGLRPDTALFSESTGRIVVSVAPQHVKNFEKLFKKFDHVHRIGHITYGDQFVIRDIAQANIQDLENAYKKTFAAW